MKRSEGLGPLHRRAVLASGLAFAAAGPGRASTHPADPAVWTPAEVAALRAAIGRAERHGLSAAAFERQLNTADSAILTRTALAWARTLGIGLVNPEEFHGVFTLERNRLELLSGLRIARALGGLEAWFRKLPPLDAGYAALSAAYQARLAERAPGPDIPAGSPIAPGQADPRLGSIAARLYERGRLGEAVAETPPRVLTLEMAAAVREFQAMEGLRPDGVVGPDTLEALNLGPKDRARQLAANLERRRWLNRRPPPTRIDVNLAAARLTYVRDGEPAWTARVVVGAPSHETPLIEDAFSQLVVNPPWFVPASIAAREILPRGPDYLRQHGMTVREGRVVQRPGPRSALGRVKFDMQNPYAIYLHDTPAKLLFAAPDRWRSHGCVRVEHAVGFARRLAVERGRGDIFEQALASGETRVVDLGEAIAVRLLYHSAFVEAGEVAFARDAYGWDARLGDRMGLEPGRVRAPVRLSPDPIAP